MGFLDALLFFDPSVFSEMSFCWKRESNEFKIYLQQQQQQQQQQRNSTQMNILILGSGGREHAFALKLTESKKVTQLFVAPGNAGTYK